MRNGRRTNSENTRGRRRGGEQASSETTSQKGYLKSFLMMELDAFMKDVTGRTRL